MQLTELSATVAQLVEHQPSNLHIHVVRCSSVFNTACFIGMAIVTPFTSAVCLCVSVCCRCMLW